MIAFVLSHQIYDDPYNQKEVKCGYDRLIRFCDGINEHVAFSYQDKTRTSLMKPDFEDDFVFVYYTNELSKAQKTEIADCIKQLLTVKKSVYKSNVPEIDIIFQRVEADDYFCFHQAD